MYNCGHCHNGEIYINIYICKLMLNIDIDLATIICLVNFVWLLTAWTQTWAHVNNALLTCVWVCVNKLIYIWKKHFKPTNLRRCIRYKQRSHKLDVNNHNMQKCIMPIVYTIAKIWSSWSNRPSDWCILTWQEATCAHLYHQLFQYYCLDVCVCVCSLFGLSVGFNLN